MPDIPAGAITSWRLKPPTKKPTKPRIRAWTPKTRTGCLTCKNRRVKCDETKPQCLRCVKGNFRCEGYADPKAWLFRPDSETTDTANSSSSSSSSESSSSPPSHDLIKVPSLWADSVDTSARRALHYFGERAQPELATFTYAAASFWQDIIPQVYTTNSTIRNAVIAVASLHEMTRSREMDPVASASDALYLKHYSKAIHDLTRPDAPPPREIVLMSCLIFLTCANLLESAPGVIIHLQSGLKLLREWRESMQSTPSSPADSTPDIILNYLEPIFARLEAQSSLIPNSREVEFHAYDLNWKASTLPDSFADFNMARNCLHDVIQYCWFQGKQVTGPILPSNPIYQKFLYQLTQWDTVFTTSFPRHDSPSWPFQRPAQGLRLHVMALSLAFRNEAFQDPMWMDTQHDVVKRMVDQIEDIIVAGMPDPAKTTYGFDDIWAHDFCLQPPMLLLGMHCRDPILRRRVVHLMRLHHCWYSDTEAYGSCASARLVELIIDTEERSPSLDSTDDSKASSPSPPPQATATTSLPAAQRIQPLAIILNIPHKLALSYTRGYFSPSSPSSPEGDGSQAPQNPTQYWTEVHWPLWTQPPIPGVKLYPFGEMIVHGNFQGMIRPQRRHCLCKSLGGPHEKMWNAPP